MTTMKVAMVYYGANDIRFEDRPVPPFCIPAMPSLNWKSYHLRYRLGIWKGKNPEIEQEATRKEGSFKGRILGHEAYWHCGRSWFRRAKL